MSSDITDSQLQTLSQRWAEDPTPHLALRLADLYRQRGELDEAVPILERGLEAHPGHVSIQVALGRYRLEAGDVERAASVLLTVVDRDPGHLVANKLLVRAHVGLGDGRSARDRLELYALLNEDDPELEALRSAVAVVPVTAEIAGPPPLPETFDVAPASSSAGAGPDLASLKQPGRRRIVGALDRDPFAELGAAPLKPAALPSFFRVEPDVEPAEPAQLVELEETVAAPVEPPAAEPDVSSLPIEAAEVMDNEPAVEIVEDDGARAEPESSDPEPAAPAEVEEGMGATATLGALYLAQGHLTDAKRTFDQVLERDPGDPEALAGAAEVERRSHTEPPAEPLAAAPNPRIARLERYLSRIRAAADLLSA